jgi:hypothetical protein
MDSLVRRRSLLRAVAGISVVFALAIASYGCAAAIDRGKVIFSTDIPTSDNGCAPGHQVTSVADTTSVYATYIFKAKPGTETVTLAVTRDGQPYIPATDLPTADTKGLDCFADTSDLSKLDNWGAGTFHVSLTSNGNVVAQGDLTVTGTGTPATPAPSDTSAAGASDSSVPASPDASAS